MSPYVEVVTFGIALVGASLGVLNFCRDYLQDRVRLRVVPKIAYRHPSGTRFGMTGPDGHADRPGISGLPKQWAVEVVNLSSFAVTIAEVGIGYDKRGGRGIFYQPEMTDNRTWPVRLQPRESVTFYAASGQKLLDVALESFRAFAKTDCGEVRFGKSDILTVETIRQMAESMDGDTA